MADAAHHVEPPAAHDARHDARHEPPDAAAGDESTVGGYAAVHRRPAAFEGPDGYSYSVEPCAAETGEPGAPWGGYFLFLRWRRVGAPGVEGHLESDFVVRADAEAAALAALGRVPLRTAKATLDTLVRRQPGGAPRRRWQSAAGDDAADGAAAEDAG